MKGLQFTMEKTATEVRIVQLSPAICIPRKVKLYICKIRVLHYCRSREYRQWTALILSILRNAWRRPFSKISDSLLISEVSTHVLNVDVVNSKLECFWVSIWLKWINLSVLCFEISTVVESKNFSHASMQLFFGQLWKFTEKDIEN